MKYSITAIVKVTANYNEGEKSSEHISTDFRVEPSGNLDQSRYNSRGLPTVEGSKALTETLIQGLIGNIHNAHQRGYRDSAEHLRDIMKKLEEGFAAVANVGEGRM